MLTNSELAEILVARGFRLLQGGHPKRKPKAPWCYLLAGWGLNYGVNRSQWDQVNFITPEQCRQLPRVYNSPGRVTLYHGHFTDPGIKTEKALGGTIISGSFDHTDYDGDEPGVGERIADRIVELVAHPIPG